MREREKGGGGGGGSCGISLVPWPPSLLAAGDTSWRVDVGIRLLL